MARTTVDSISRSVQKRMARAAELVERARRELDMGRREIRCHPEFKVGHVEGVRISDAWWLDQCLMSVLDDAPLDEASGWIRDDIAPQARRRQIEYALADDRRIQALRAVKAAERRAA